MTTCEIDHHVPVPRLSSNAQRRERILRSSILGGFLLIAILIFSLEAAAAEFGPVPNAEVNKARAALGKRLFFDSRLSGDTQLSCASCHQPDKGFSDGLALGRAYPGSLHFRNTPTLINVALRESWMHDGRLGTNLNDVTREMLTETYLMNMDMRLMQERIKQDPVYVKMFEDAGLGEPSNGGVRNAIPEYLKTLTSRGAAFEEGKMNSAAKRGFKLFKGKANCVSCHSGIRFSDDRAHVTGVPGNDDIWEDPKRHITFVTYAKFMGVENYMNLRHDPGAYIRTHQSMSDRSFLTPTLRELKYTAPYMHNGMLKSLADVVNFYNAGGGDAPNKSKLLKPLELSVKEQADLVSFLESLSGDPLTGDEHVWKEVIPSTYPAIPDWINTPN
ncbi:MAG: cytochrome c peroxidase [Gammaproteobacteria bacterium]